KARAANGSAVGGCIQSPQECQTATAFTDQPARPLREEDSMSLMAGFDLVLELSNRSLLDLIKSYLRIGAVLVNPPFDVNLPFGNDNAHLVVKDLHLDLNADDTVTLTMDFDSASVTITE